MTKKNLKKITSLFFTSRVRLKVMRLFFNNPKSQFHMREIARIVDEQINAVRRELMSMENTQLLFSHMNGIKKYFTLNPDFPFYNEFRSIIMKSNSLGHAVFKNRKKIGPIKFAVLSHTYLSGEISDQNNIDLLIIGDPDMKALEECIKAAQEEEEKEVFYTVISEKEFDLRKRRKDALIYSLMVLPRGMVIGSDEEFVM